MTQLRQAEETRARLAAIVESSDDAIVSEDLDGTIITWNQGASRIFGYAPGEAIGRSITMLAPPDLPDEIPGFLAAVRRGERVGQVETRRRHQDGTLIDVSVTVSPIRDATGRIVGVSKVARDIGDRKRSDGALRTYAARLENLHAIGQAILAARSPEEIAGTALNQLAQLVPCWMGSVVIFDFEAGEARIFASTGGVWDLYPSGVRRILEVVREDELEFLRQGRTSAVADLQEVASMSQVIVVLKARGMRSYVQLPLRHRGRLIGSLNFGSDRPAAYAAEHIEVAREVADLLAIAIWQALLFEEVQSAKGRLEVISCRLIRAEEDERRRIARELHDEIGQALTAAKLEVQRASRQIRSREAKDWLVAGTELIERTLEQVRDISLALRPSLLDDLGLVTALRSLVTGLSRRSGITSQLEAEETIGRLHPDVETTCFRVAQEALTNVERHAQLRGTSGSNWPDRHPC